VTYWSAPGRYVVTPPVDAKRKGLWQVRLTVEGSQWLLSYNRLRKLTAPPTAVPVPVTDQQRTWEDWLTKKILHDRWQALQAARAANRQMFDVDAPAPDKTTLLAEPAAPGPIPADMLAAVGNPPDLAAAVVPMAYTVAFDDTTIQYEDNTRLGSPRYPFYRFVSGVMAGGQSIRSVPPERLAKLFQMAGCDDSQARVMRAVSQLEGGFDAVNTYDTGFVSVGFIQFASLKEGAGSLGAFLASYKQDDPTDFSADFRKYGIDVSTTGLLDVVDPTTGAEVSGPDANVRVIADKRLIAVFQRAGLKSDPFCAAQVKSAKIQFYPADDPITITTFDGSTLAGKVSDFVKSEAGIATLFDRKVNTGNLKDLTPLVSQLATDHRCTSLSDLAAYEKDIVKAMKYRADFTKDSTLSQPQDAPR
jgi:hypothetical protein